MLFGLRAEGELAEEGGLWGDSSLGGIISFMRTKGRGLDSVSLTGIGLAWFGVGARFGGIGIGSVCSGCLVRGRVVV